MTPATALDLAAQLRSSFLRELWGQEGKLLSLEGWGEWEWRQLRQRICTRQRSPCSRTASREEQLGPAALEDIDISDSKPTEQDWGSVQTCDHGMLVQRETGQCWEPPGEVVLPFKCLRFWFCCVALGFLTLLPQPPSTGIIGLHPHTHSVFVDTFLLIQGHETRSIFTQESLWISSNNAHTMSPRPLLSYRAQLGEKVHSCGPRT